MSKSVRFFGFFLCVLATSSSFHSAFAVRKIAEAVYSSDCWDAINAVKGCQNEIDTAMKSNEIEVSYDCCKVILHGMPEKCAAVVFSSGGEFSPDVSGAVNEYCDGMGITPPVLETEDTKVEEN
uniref:Prolamin-like domain-containing protein n=1 Tax=Cucumis sativus TaxID=3659 RepID=A0A0A0LEG0_CUCSA